MQTILPLIPEGSSKISDVLYVFRNDNQWSYFLAGYPVYIHDATDQKMFRFITAQAIESGTCRQRDIIKCFGVSKSSVIRSQKKLKEGGAEAFFQKKKSNKSGTILTPSVLENVQYKFNKGQSRCTIAEELSIKPDTLRKALKDGRLKKPDQLPDIGTTKSLRSEKDTETANGLGMACLRVVERAMAAFGKMDGVAPQFEKSFDVPNGSVLCALPALISNGLFEKSEEFLGRIKGYYSIIQILILLAIMALCRIKTIEQLRGQTPGEFGKLLGLDRIPEVRCLRKKLTQMSSGESAEQWAANLSRYWMESNEEATGFLYIDGHVRVYNGSKTKLPRKYVSRERLCLRGITDYWVNDATGQPFFVIEKQIDDGLLNVLRTNIIPRLLSDVSSQPDDKELNQNPYCCRFVLVFDREGYSPSFFSEVWKKYRISCITYHKHPKEKWPTDWFKECEAIMPRGEKVTMPLAEMGSFIGSGKNKIWVREIRRLTESGHQTSIISTAYDLPTTQIAAQMFSRWCQENFFGYMKQHFGIDLLQEYGVEDFSDTEKVVNPLRRETERTRNSIQNKLRYRRAAFAALTMNPEAEDDQKKYNKWLTKKAALLEEIDMFENQLDEIKTSLKTIPKHIEWAELEEKDKFYKLVPGRKRLMDTIKMIAYRAETAMVNLLVDNVTSSSDARRLLQDLFNNSADIMPDPEKKLLTVRIHSAARPAANRSLKTLIKTLNDSETIYPGTDLKLTYELIGEQNIS